LLLLEDPRDASEGFPPTPDLPALNAAKVLPGSTAVVGSNMQPVAQIGSTLDVEVEQQTHYMQTVLGNVHNVFGGMHLLKLLYKLYGKIFGPIFLCSFISIIYPKTSEQDYVLFPSDHRKAKEMYAQIAMGFTMAQTIEYIAHIKASYNPTQAATILSKVTSLQIKEYTGSFLTKRPSLFPIHLFLRAADLIGLLRVSGKTADFHLYRQCCDMAMPFLTTGNALTYICSMLDQKIYLVTCSEYDFLVRSKISFCVLTTHGNWMFCDNGQEINVSMVRQMHSRDNKVFTKREYLVGTTKKFFSFFFLSF